MKLTVLLLATPVVWALQYCPPPGPVLPPPKIKISHPKGIWHAPEFRNLPFNEDSSYVIKASIGDTNVLSHSWIAPSQSLADPNADPANIKSRVASITKLFTVLAVLLSKDQIPWESSIRDYIPELQGKIWDEVTISALAGHTAGLGRFATVGDLSVNPHFKADFLGIPQIDGARWTCDIFPGGRGCSREEAIAIFNSPQDMPRSPSSGPLYSNVGFNLLGMALESVYGTSYENIIQRMILDPLGMENTTFKMPDQTENAFLPGPEEHWLLGDYGNFNPTGGLWSTTNDITTFMRAIASSKLLSPVRTREWLRGLSVTSSLHQLVGAPWELYRPDNLDITFQRPIDIYTKAGYVEGYGSYAVFVPEYDLTISILAAGNSAHQASRSLLQEVTKKLIPLADQITRKEAEVKYGGKYSGNDNGINVTVTLDDGPGLALTYWKMNWQDILAYLPQVAGLGDNGKTISARIYPTDPDSLDTDKHFWQIHMSVPQPESDWADMDCMTWQEMDKLRYIREPLDAAYFVMEGPVAKAVHFPGWRMTLERLEGMPSGAIEIIPDA